MMVRNHEYAELTDQRAAVINLRLYQGRPESALGLLSLRNRSHAT
jgi:hypothetical protein